MTIRFGERPAALIAEVLQGRSSPAARSALRLLEEAAIQAVRGARRAKRNEINLSNVKADTRETSSLETPMRLRRLEPTFSGN